MDITTPWGVKWPMESFGEITLYIAFVLLIIILLGVIKYLQMIQEKKINDHQLFLFRLKRTGLTNFQIKIINNMVETLRLSNPTELLSNSDLFEKAVGKFLHFLRSSEEKEDSLTSICRDITITYEKLYHPSDFKKPLESMNDLETEKLIYLMTKTENVYLGKITGKEKENLIVKLFREGKNLKDLSEEQTIRVNVWRPGDAEYMFTTETVKIDSNILTIAIPDEFTRGKEFRHPYLDVIVPVTVKQIPKSTIQEPEEMKATIFKLNDYEAVIRISKNLDYSRDYIINFEIMEYIFDLKAKIISNKTIEEESIFYYTFKFLDTSEAGQKVLKRFMSENL